MSFFGVIPVLSFNYLLLSMLVIRCYAVVHKITANGLQLGEVAEIEAQMFGFAQKFNRRTAVEFSTKPAILPSTHVKAAIQFHAKKL